MNRDNVRRQTALAWGRTSLAASGFGIALVRLGVGQRSVSVLIAALALLLCGLVLAARGRVLYVRNDADPATPALRFVTAVALLVAALIFVINLV